MNGRAVRAPAVAIGAGIADVRERHRPGALVDHRDGRRGAHPGHRGVVDGPLEDPRVRRTHESGDPVFAVDRRGALLEGRGCQARGDLAGLGAAHPVRDRE